MRTDAKVVHLNKVAPEHKPSSPAGRLPVALISVRDKAAQQLRQALQSLFDNADDSLFEIADRATSNAEQNAFRGYARPAHEAPQHRTRLPAAAVRSIRQAQPV